MTNLFFVYGTLKRGEGNHRLLEDSKYVGKGLTLATYKAYHCGFPAVSPDDEGLPMLGELYNVDSHLVVQALDRLESNGSFYTRIIRPVKILDFFEQEVNAWIYEVNDATRYFGGYCPINQEHNAYYWSRNA
jgi:gamma-glutamylaminecyclotransferase